MTWKAWVDCDFGHQADAENDVGLDQHVRDNNPKPPAQHRSDPRRNGMATNNKDWPNRNSRRRSQDEVWMVHNWVANNYSSATAALLFQLQAAEAARREEARKKRETQ